MDGNLMADDRIGTYGEPRPQKTIGGWAVEAQCRMTVGIGNNQYVIVGHSDSGYEAEIEKLISDNKSTPKREVKRGQQEAEDSSQEL